MSSFFGYLGFDAVCCVAGEAINAERNVPLSIMITLGLVTSLYVSASLALVGMQNYTEISSESGYPMAFHSNGVVWASQLTAVRYLIGWNTCSISHRSSCYLKLAIGGRSDYSPGGSFGLTCYAAAFAICFGKGWSSAPNF